MQRAIVCKKMLMKNRDPKEETKETRIPRIPTDGIANGERKYGTRMKTALAKVVARALAGGGAREVEEDVAS
eukprot:4974105-Karenia_brevis.AAC.1